MQGKSRSAIYPEPERNFADEVISKVANRLFVSLYNGAFWTQIVESVQEGRFA